jgi:dihydroxyacetone kinase-like protein
MITKQHILNWLTISAAVIEENRQYLTKLDTAIGDADHGNNMYRGFKKVNDQISTYQDKDIGAILKAVAMTLISTVGGASGPLYGTMFLQAGTSLAGKNELTAEELGSLLTNGLQGIKMRGKASLGEKTIIDALEPAVEAYNQSIAAGKTINEALKLAVDSAEKGAEGTIPMIARKGRASYLGERSKGHKDPGATSVSMLVAALRDACLQ